MYVDSSLGVVVADTGRIGFPLIGLLVDKPDGLSGMLGLVGDPGRLANALTIGGIGVLDGRSMGTVKFLNDDADESPLRVSLGWRLSDPVIAPEGAEGREKLGLSSSSSIEGKA